MGTSSWRAAIIALVALACGQSQIGEAGTSPNVTSAVIAGYLASWKVRPDGPRISDISGQKLTHLIYAFGEISADGLAKLADPCADIGRCEVPDSSTSSFGGNFRELAKLKQSNPQLRISIALGGWAGSKYFSIAAASAEARARFVQSVVDVFFQPYAGLFDGVDIDWEFPVAGGQPGNLNQPADRENFTLLIGDLHRKLAELSSAEGQKFELTIAISADSEKLGNLELTALARQVDWLNLMAYDYYDGSEIAGFNAPLFASTHDPNRNYNIDATVKALIRSGVPPQKVALGLPFYGRAIAGVPRKDNGVFQRGSSKGSEAWGGVDGIDYRDLVARRPEELGFYRYWNSEAEVPWLYNPAQQIWISYDDPTSIARKAMYARAYGLRGVMIWDLLADDGSLLAAIHKSAAELPH
jgi:chitinase